MSRAGDPTREQQARATRHVELAAEARDEVARLELARRRASQPLSGPRPTDSDPTTREDHS